MLQDQNLYKMSNTYKMLGVGLYLAIVSMVSATTDARREGNCDVPIGHLDQDNETYVCCNAILIPNNIGKNASCCGEVLYKYDTQMCCNGKLYEDVPDLQCCGGEIFNVKYEVCSSNNIVIGEDFKLCGNEYYHSGYRMCCGQNTYPIDAHTRCCGVHVHDTSTSTCIDGEIVHLWMECCGGSAMNTRDQLCCDGGSGEHFPVDKSGPDDDQCCETDGRTYTSATHDCGPYGVEQRRLLLYPCGRQAYDPIRDICCDGFVYKGGKTRRLQCRDIISPTQQTSAEVIYHLGCPNKCSISTVAEVHQVYRCPFHALIAKRIRKSQHNAGGHRRYLVTSDLMTSVDVSGAGQRLFKFSSNCKSCIPKSRSIIVVVNEFASAIKTFSIVMNTKMNRKYLRKICN